MDEAAHSPRREGLARLLFAMCCVEPVSDAWNDLQIDRVQKQALASFHVCSSGKDNCYIHACPAMKLWQSNKIIKRLNW